MRRFLLYPHCLLVSGAKRGAIYNLKSGDVYSIDERARRIIEFCEKGTPVANIVVSGVKNTAVESYLQSLEHAELGQFLSDGELLRKIKIDKPSDLEFIWLEVTKRCNLF